MSNGLKIIWAAAVALIGGVILGATMFEKANPARAGPRAAGNERIIMIAHCQAADPY